MHDVEVSIDPYHVLDHLDVKDVVGFYGVEDVVRSIETKELGEALKTSFYEHDPYILFSFIRDELDPEFLRGETKKLEQLDKEVGNNESMD